MAKSTNSRKSALKDISPLPGKITAEKVAPLASTHHSGGKTIDEILEARKGETKKQQPPCHFCHQIPVFSCVYLSWLAFFLLTFSLSLFFLFSLSSIFSFFCCSAAILSSSCCFIFFRNSSLVIRLPLTTNADESYHCGECGLPYGEDDELWIGCNGVCNGWYHILCVGIAEQNIPENFYCGHCTS